MLPEDFLGRFASQAAHIVTPTAPIGPERGLGAMLGTCRTVAFVGPEARIVRAEVHVFDNGLPGLTMVGLAGRAVKESEQRIRSALECSMCEWPRRKIVANLAPSGLRKEGTHLDLALALGLLDGARQVPEACLDGWLVLGELGLDGSVRAVPGVLPAAIACREGGFDGIICPEANAGEAALIPRIKVVGVPDLDRTVGFLRGGWVPPEPERSPQRRSQDPPDLAEVRGQGQAKRALQLAAAGGHNLLMCGPPGCGKTMLARRMPGILPAMSEDECLEVSKIRSLAGLMLGSGALADTRPMRSPHHHISLAGLIGGGSGLARPGELALAHRGVLFLDELPLFPRHVLESLRAPLEEGVVRIARSGGTVSYPCCFALLAAMNPCPCGYFLDERRACSCSEWDRIRYQSRLSGPMLDRFDLTVGLVRPARKELMSPPGPPISGSLRAEVEEARALQSARYGGSRTNGSVESALLRRRAALSGPARTLLEASVDAGLLSGRGLDRVLRVSRTIADLTGSASVEDDHVAEALSLRTEVLGSAA